MTDARSNPLESILDRALESAFDEIGARPDPNAATPDPAVRPTLPQQVGRYRIEGLLGCGGMGQVFLAHDPDLQRDLALKILPEHLSGDSGRAPQFLHEARLCSQLQHPGVVPIHEVGKTDAGQPFFTMKILSGQTLHQRLRDREHPLQDRPALLGILLKIGQTVAFAHGEGVLHRDIKSTNVMLGDYGEVHLLDWGLACRMEDGRYTPRSSDGGGRIAGTPSHMSPEQANGQELSPRSDVFSLGALLCEILTGAAPYLGETRDEVFLRASRAWLDDAHSRLQASGAHPDLLALCLACLHADPEQRPADAQRFCARLGQFIHDAENREREAELALARIEAGAAQERRARRLRTALLGIVCMGLLAAVWAYFRDREQQESRRQQDLNAATNALAETRRLARAADALPLPSPKAWQIALASARQTATFFAERALPAQTGAGLAEIRRRIETGLDQAARDARMLTWLQENSPHLADDRRPSQVDAKYAQQFEDFGVQAPFTDPQAQGRGLRSSRILLALANGLDAWSFHRRRHRLPAWQQLLKISLAADPDPMRQEIRRAWLSDDRGALRRIAESEELREQPPETLDLVARSLRNLGQLDLARRVLRLGVLLHPSNFNLCHDLAAMLVRPGTSATEALRLHSMACAARPNSPHALADMARSLIDLKRYTSAKKILLRARDIDPNYPRTWLYLGLAEDRLGNRDAARRCMMEVLARSPEHPEALRNVAALDLNQGRNLDQVLNRLRKAFALVPSNAQIAAELAQIEVLMGNLRAAERPAAVAVAAGSPTGLHLLANLRVRQGRLKEARVIFARLLRRPTPLPRHQVAAAFLELDLGEFRTAARLMTLGHRRGSALGSGWNLPSGEWAGRFHRLLLMSEREGPLADEGPRDRALRAQMHICRGDWAEYLTRAAQDRTATASLATHRFEVLAAAQRSAAADCDEDTRDTLLRRATAALERLTAHCKLSVAPDTQELETLVREIDRCLHDRRHRPLDDPQRFSAANQAAWQAAKAACRAARNELLAGRR